MITPLLIMILNLYKNPKYKLSKNVSLNEDNSFEKIKTPLSINLENNYLNKYLTKKMIIYV